MAEKAVLALGSNIGNGKEHLDDAVKALGLVPGVTVTAVSRYYITKPWGYTAQADFTNACCEVETTLSPEALLGVCLGIEAGFGRIREFRNGPRIIDIDLLMYADEKRDTEELKLPHPGIKERDFVLLPLSDLAQDGFVLGLDVRAALKDLGEPVPTVLIE